MAGVTNSTSTGTKEAYVQEIQETTLYALVMADSSNDAPPKKKARSNNEPVCDSTCDMSGQACHSTGRSDRHNSESVTDQIPDSSNSYTRSTTFMEMSSNSQVSSTVNSQRPQMFHESSDIPFQDNAASSSSNINVSITSGNVPNRDYLPSTSNTSLTPVSTTGSESPSESVSISSSNPGADGNRCELNSQSTVTSDHATSNTADLSENIISVQMQSSDSQPGTSGISSTSTLDATNAEPRDLLHVKENGRSTLAADCLSKHGKGMLLREADVGITEYISTHEGFNGVIKQRYSDFLVNEINLSGEMIRLTELSVPISKTKEESKPCDILSEEWVTQLQELVDNKDKSKDVALQVGENKETRGKIHQAIREMFPGLESSTVKVDDKTCIKVMLKGAQGRSRSQGWPSGRGNYCRFVLYKENKDVSEALFLIAKYLRMKASAFTFAGTKDRRARTCQEITVYRVTAENLQKLNRTLRNIAMGNFRYCNNPLKLGDLKGNRFVIVLRNVTGKDDQILKGLTSLREVGFINYYGMQRFGTTSVATHHVGRALMKSNWQEAVELILKPREGDNDDLAEARKFWWETRNAKDALKMMGRRQSIEKQLLIGLDKYDKNDLVGALNMIPRNSRLMYVHSYQSYVWNSLVSRRIQKYGLKPVIGDLVTRSQMSTSEESENDKKGFMVPDVVTEDSLNSWDVHHIVMPLPGWDVKYPENDVGQWYKDLMAQDGLDINHMKHRVKDYSLAGAYRHIIVKPEDVTWEICTYDDVTIPLVQSDFDRLNDVSIPEPVTDGKFKALKLELSLPSSVYATMAIREVLKSDTSAAHQTTLNVT